MCVSRSFSQYGVLGICTFDTFFSQYGVLGICTFDTFYHGYFPGAGLPFLFSFGCIPFYITFHSQKSTPHAFARREEFLPAFLPASCFPLQPEQTPAGCFARHWLLFAASMSRVWLACRLHAGTTGRVCLLVSCGHVLPKPVASCSTFSLLLLGEVTIIFRRKDSVRSGAA